MFKIILWFLVMLELVFVPLKLGGLLNISWFIILLPFMISILLFIILFFYVCWVFKHLDGFGY